MKVGDGTVMTRSAYIIGGAGSGKSTFTAQLLDELLRGDDMGELEDLFSLRNAKALVTLRGHKLFSPGGGPAPGLYLGCWRESFPGTDGLDRASSPVGEAWLEAGDLPSFIVAEGATLATRRFLGALHRTTELLLVHLYADDEVKAERFNRRGSNQDSKFVTGTATRAANRLAEAQANQVRWLSIDTNNDRAWDLALDLTTAHLL